MAINFGARLKQARKAKGLTTKELGKQCYVSDTSIKRYEMNMRQPSFSVIEDLAAALGVLPKYFFEEMED
jgi:transcriptional regulator with XRE-family HTH domain